MARRPHANRPPDLLSCFDRNLHVFDYLFEDCVTICDIPVDGPPVVCPGRPETLRFDEHEMDLSVTLDWLNPFADQSGWAYYLHHHDNIVVDLAWFETYDRVAFLQTLKWFRTHPASEGGTNLSGVIGRGQAWVFVIENDNQGRFRVNYYGPAVKCRELRSILGIS